MGYSPIHPQNMNARRDKATGKVQIFSGDNHCWWNHNGSLRTVDLTAPVDAYTNPNGGESRVLGHAKNTVGWWVNGGGYKYAGIRPASMSAAGTVQLEDTFVGLWFDGEEQFQDWNDVEVLANNAVRVGNIYGRGGRKRVEAVKVPIDATTFSFTKKVHCKELQMPVYEQDEILTWRQQDGGLLCRDLKPLPRYVDTMEQILGEDGVPYDVLEDAVVNNGDGTFNITKRPKDATAYAAFLADMAAGRNDRGIVLTEYLANQTTVYVDSGDGYVNVVAQGVWSTARNHTGQYSSFTSHNYIVSVNTDVDLYRGIGYLDLTGVSSVSAASLFLDSVGDSYNTGKAIIVKSTATTPFSSSDYSSTGDGDAIMDAGVQLTGTGYNELILNTAGISYLNAGAGSGVSFMIREYDHDYLDVAPDAEYKVLARCSFRTGTSEDPYFEITDGAATPPKKAIYII